MSRSRIFASVPNLITAGRLLLVPLIVVLIVERRWREVFGVFVLAGVSDAIDGFLARRFDLGSALGAWLDAAADKALLVSIYVTLARVGMLPDWIAVVVVARDAMIVAAVGVAALLGKPVPIRPLMISKVNTTAQIALAAAVLGGQAFGVPFGAALPSALMVVAALTVASMAAYLAQWLIHLSR